MAGLFTLVHEERKGMRSMEQDALLYKDLEKVLITKEEISLKVKELGRRISQDYAGKSPVMVCILKGAAVFFSDLIREIDLPLTLDFMAISSYGSATKTSGVVRILKDLDNDILGKDVIVVEDIVDSGITLNYLQKLLKQRGANSLRIATLLDKPARRKIPDLRIDYFCFDIPDAFVVGYGLDYDQKYRNLPDIGVLSPRIYE
jgi:hypoxanthine phosphoribosyltransferase